MSLAERVATFEPPNRWPVCTVGKLVKTMDEPDRDTFATLLGSETTSVDIARILNAEYDSNISAHTLARHRSHGCRCG